jgi:hypothetical protein
MLNANLDIASYQIQPQRSYSKHKSSSDFQSIMYEAHEQLGLNPETVYNSIIEKFMSPWLKSASKMNGEPISLNQEFPIFNSAHFLELQLLSFGYFNHFRITRYTKRVRSNGNMKWMKHLGKPILQSVVLPCSMLASYGLTPHFLKASNNNFFKHDQYRRLLQYIIDVSENSDLPDHVDIFIALDDYPLIETNHEYSLPQLRQLLRNTRWTSIVPPIFSFCSKANYLNIPFVYLDQLIEKPVETLVQKLMIYRSRNDNNFAMTLPEFKERNDTAIWRGGTSGLTYTVENWLTAPRSQLVQLSMMAPDLLDARFTTCLDCTAKVAESMNISLGSWINTPFVSSDTYFGRKFLIDIDGNGWSSRFYELLLTGATVFKVYRADKCDEFWYDLLTPGVDFVSISPDFRDLFLKLIYYREHPDEALQIANNGMRRVSFLLRADVWPRYVTGIFRAIAALQTKPDSLEEQQIALLGLSLGTCSSAPLDYCNCNSLYKQG